MKKLTSFIGTMGRPLKHSWIGPMSCPFFSYTLPGFYHKPFSAKLLLSWLKNPSKACLNTSSTAPSLNLFRAKESTTISYRWLSKSSRPAHFFRVSVLRQPESRQSKGWLDGSSWLLNVTLSIENSCLDPVEETTWLLGPSSIGLKWR